MCWSKPRGNSVHRSLPFTPASQKTYRTKLANRKNPAKQKVAGFCCIRIKHFAPIWGFKGQWRMITRYRKLRLGYQCNFLHAKLMVQFLCLATSINPSDTPKTQNSSHQVPVRLNVAFRCSKFSRIQISTLRGTNISHLRKRNIIFPATLKLDMWVPWRVLDSFYIPATGSLIFSRHFSACF